MIRKYYTLKDLFDIVAPGKAYQYTGVVEEHAIRNLIGALYPPLTDTLLDTAEADTLWCQYIVPRYYEMACFYVDNPESDFYEEEWRNWFRKFNSILVRSYDNYKIMIGYFNQAKDNLMDNIKSTSESKFNDTPQNVQIQGIYDWSDDNHLSNITRNETSTELGSKISRLKEIEDNITDYYEKWMGEFRGLFIYD